MAAHNLSVVITRRDVLGSVLELAAAAASVGFVAGLWAMTGHWHTAVSGHVNISRNQLDDFVPSWLVNIGFPALILWLTAMWLRSRPELNRLHPREPDDHQEQ